MTETMLVALIATLCNGVVITDKYNFDQGVQEKRFACWDKYNNCAVKDGGKILTLKEFNRLCLKK